MEAGNVVARIGVVTDIHGTEEQWPHTERLLQRALETFAQQRVDAVVDLGDRINEVSADADRQLVQRIAAALRSPGWPVLHLYGNHDTVYLGKEEQNRWLGKAGNYEECRVGGARLLLLDSMETVSGGPISASQLHWLEGRLSACEEPALVFCHHPLDEPDPAGHPYFSQHPEEVGVANAAAVRAVLERFPWVFAVVQGHLHRWSVHCRGGVAYITLPPLGPSDDGSRPEGAHAVVTLRDRSVHVALFDADGLQKEWQAPAPVLSG